MSQAKSTVNDYALAWLRIAVGFIFLIFSQYKVWGDEFIRHGFANQIHLFLRAGAYPFMAPILRDFVLPHATFFAYLVGYGELCIGLALLFGIMVRGASFFGVIYMGVLLLSSSFPGPDAAIEQYLGAALSHVALALCFVAFTMGDATRVWSISSYYSRKLRGSAQDAPENADSAFVGSNVFGK